MINHIVLFQWKPEATEERIATLLDEMRGLKGRIPGIASLTCGTDFSGKAQGYTLCLALGLITLLGINARAADKHAPSVPVFTCVDTMKESRDTVTNPLTDAQIDQDVRLTATLPVTHISVDTPYDYPEYLARWVGAVRRTGKRVWFRCAFNAWEGSYNTPATMTPAEYITRLRAFVAAHAGLFRAGDIFDPLPEPENGPYWVRTSPQGSSWSWKDAPNATTDEYNRFFLQASRAAQEALALAGIKGVITTVRSTNGYIAARPMTLYPATVAVMGRVTTDTYVGQAPNAAPAEALRALQAEVEGIERVRHVPLVLGEFGYSTQGLVSDAQQQAVLKPELAWLRGLPYLAGLNYWHGAGYLAPDTYNGTRLFTGTRGAWTLRPAARDLAQAYAALLARAAGSERKTRPVR